MEVIKLILIFAFLFFKATTSPLTLTDLDEWLFAQEEEVNSIYNQIVLAPDTPPGAESSDYNLLQQFVEEHS